jgi:2Fe-2S ferredoxin
MDYNAGSPGPATAARFRKQRGTTHCGLFHNHLNSRAFDRTTPSPSKRQAAPAVWYLAIPALYCIRLTDERARDLMPRITYVEHDGSTHTVDAEVGATVMETALRNGIGGIVAECGGSCTCATCLVHVDEAWADRLAPRSAGEEDMLDFAFEVKPTSRLSCQIVVEEALDGLIVHTPAYQGR